MSRSFLTGPRRADRGVAEWPTIRSERGLHFPNGPFSDAPIYSLNDVTAQCAFRRLRGKDFLSVQPFWQTAIERRNRHLSAAPAEGPRNQEFGLGGRADLVSLSLCAV